MRRTLRTILIGVLVVALSFNPAAAWFFNRGGGCGYGGGYGCGYGGWGHRAYGHGYRASYYGGWGYCGYSHQPVVYHGSYCGGGHCGGWGSYGGCDSCGWDSCDGCGSYSYGESYGGYESYDSHDGVIVDSYDGYEVAPERAPMAPADMPANGRSTMPPPTQGPSRVERPMDTTPVPQLPAEPMPPTTPPADDLLPPTEQPPADDLFNGTEAAPTTPPPAEDTNDLFAPTTEPAETTPPAEAPAETPPPADTEPADDLFGTPLTEEAPAETTEEAPADTEEMPAEEAPAEEAETTDEDDIFGTSSGILREPGGLASTELRTWVDNTGEHSCRGRLIRFLDGKVRLLKDNGRTTTVPLYRLSASDLAFVHRQASAQQATVAGQLATSMTGLPLLAN